MIATFNDSLNTLSEEKSELTRRTQLLVDKKFEREGVLRKLYKERETLILEIDKSEIGLSEKKGVEAEENLDEGLDQEIMKEFLKAKEEMEKVIE